MSENATIHDEAPARKYFTQMLNMAEDDLDPFQYRLLAHYIRWYDGKPYPESIRQTASATKMSVNKVQSALDELSALGYLEVYRPTQQEARNGATIKVKVLDRWIENINRYQRKPVSNSTQAVSEMTQGSIKNDTPPVLNMIRLEEQKKEEQKTGDTRKSARPSKSALEAKAIELIKAWVVASGGVDMGQSYDTTTRKAKAREMLKWDKPVTCEEITEYIKGVVASGKDAPDFVWLPDRISVWRGLQGKAKIIALETETKPIDLSGWYTPESAYAKDTQS